MRVPLLAAAIAVLVLPSAASAATFDVTKTDDDTSCTPGDCSLRGAIADANASAGADTINVPAGHYVLSIAGTGEDTGADGDLDVLGETTIQGAGSGATIVDAGGDSGIGERVFHVQPQGGAGLAVAFRDLQITGGRDCDGGGVSSQADLTLQRTLVTGNRVCFLGGGVAQTSDTTLLTIVDSTVSENVGFFGGGVVNVAGGHSDTSDIGIVIERSTIADNDAAGEFEGDPDGAGVATTFGGDLHIRNSTISGNEVFGFDDDGSGGGVYAGNFSDVEITNTTISGNVAHGGYGGGIVNIDSTITLLNVTVAGNDVAPLGPTALVTDPGAPGTAGDNIDAIDGDYVFKNTIVSDAESQNCRGRFGSEFTSNGHNLEEGDSCGFDAGTDATGTDPQLGALANNGGPTRTRALPKGSPAVNSADNSACPAADQRGVARPQPAGGTCDRGAYERAAHDLSIQKLASASTFAAGEQVVFTLAVSNAGPADAPGVTVTDVLPDGLTFVSAEPSQGTCSGGRTTTCSLGTLAAGQDADVVIRATVDREGEFTNTATVAGDDTFEESNPSNNRASRTVTGRPRPSDPECRDTVAPITELKQSRVRVRRGRVHLSGTTYDPDPCASGVNRVLVSMARVRGRHLVNCRFIRSKTRYILTPPPGMNCQDPVLFLAKGGVSTGTTQVTYSFIYFVDLPDGIYRAQARAFDNAGNKERPTKGRNIRKFYVR
ncbi:MAG: hypothetical protein M3340_03675 [Actinomycetota bacterium]|nr:hypothetical protein [Actinomycetota bacterium]